MSIETHKDAGTEDSLMQELTEHELEHVSGGGSKPGGTTDPFTVFGGPIGTTAQ